MRRRDAAPHTREQRDRRVTGRAPAPAGRPTRAPEPPPVATEPPGATTQLVAAPPSRRRIIGLLAVAVAVVAIVFAAATILGGPGRKVETGIVVSVQATGLTAVQGFSIRTIDGRTIDFRIDELENGTTFAPGHLAEHKVTLVPVRVTYVDRDGSHLAVRIEDAP